MERSLELNVWIANPGQKFPIFIAHVSIQFLDFYWFKNPAPNQPWVGLCKFTLLVALVGEFTDHIELKVLRTSHGCWIRASVRVLQTVYVKVPAIVANFTFFEINEAICWSSFSKIKTDS